MSIVTAYRKRDGARVEIPAAWLGHPVLGKPYRKIAPAKPAEGKQADKADNAPAAGDTGRK